MRNNNSAKMQNSVFANNLQRITKNPIELNGIGTKKSSAGLSIVWNHANRTPVAISFANEQVGHQTMSAKTVSELALSFISANRKMFHLDNPESELKVIEEFQDSFALQVVSGIKKFLLKEANIL